MILKTMSKYFFNIYKYTLRLAVIKGTLGGFFVVLPGRESNPGCLDKIPTSDHLTTQTPLAKSKSELFEQTIFFIDGHFCLEV